MNLREFEAWALAQGSVANPEPDNGFKGQCVSLVQQYLDKVCGIGFKARGNAKDWANNIIEGWDKFDVSNSIKPGDVLVYTSGKYGHIVIVDAELQCLEQNRNYNGIVTVSPIRKGYSCILRSRQAIDVETVKTEQTTKSIIDLANEVIAGKYGNGEVRKQALGSLYSEVQAKVNEILNSKIENNRKPIDEVAKEVINGKWGNGQDRKQRLTNAGYNYYEVQARVNQVLKY